MAREKDFETAIARYPELLEEGLRLIGRQVVVHGRRMDLLFEDPARNQLVAELKWGPIRDKDIGQIMAYEGWRVSNGPVRVMLVGTRVPPNIQATLDHHGIGWREITASELRKFLLAKGDEELAETFDDTHLDLGVSAPVGVDRAGPTGLPKPSARSGPAALFVPVEGKWLVKARDYFSVGNNLLYFYTNAGIGQAAMLDIRRVYFKEKGQTAVTAVADFVELKTEKPVSNRLPESTESTGTTGLFYYGFRNLKQIDPISLQELRYYSTDVALRNDVPGARIIVDPGTDNSSVRNDT